MRYGVGLGMNILNMKTQSLLVQLYENKNDRLLSLVAQHISLVPLKSLFTKNNQNPKY